MLIRATNMYKQNTNETFLLIYDSLQRKTTPKDENYNKQFWIQIHIKNHHDIIREKLDNFALVLWKTNLSYFTSIQNTWKSFIYTNLYLRSWDPRSYCNCLSISPLVLP